MAFPVRHLLAGALAVVIFSLGAWAAEPEGKGEGRKAKGDGVEPAEVPAKGVAGATVKGKGAEEPVDKVNKETDKAHLAAIWQAIMAYKKDHGQVPDYLSDLVPEYLPDKQVLLSPVENAYRRGSVDPKLKTSYSYEFSALPYGDGGLPFRKIKEAQMKEFGPVVPILRCFAHGKVVMNVAFSGDYFESELFWETAPAARELMQKLGLGPGFEDGDVAEVRVVDAQTGAPLEGAEVRLTQRTYHGLSLPDRTVKTDAEGKAQVPLGPPPSRSLSVKVVKAGYAAPGQFWREHSLPVELTWPMTPAATIGGVVKDRAGAPLAGATVTVYGKWGPIGGVDPGVGVAGLLAQRLPAIQVGGLAPMEVQTVDSRLAERCTTDEAGRWHCDTLPMAFGPLRLMVDQPTAWRAEFLCGEEDAVEGVAPRAAQKVDRDALLAQTAEFRLEPAPVVTGILRGPDGAPLAGELVSIVNTSLLDATGRFQRSVPTVKQKVVLVTNAGGRFSVPWPRPAKLWVSAIPANLAMTGHIVQVTPGLEPIELKASARRTVVGRVHDPEGKALAGVRVVFIGWADYPTAVTVAVTDAKGEFMWNAAPNDQIGLTFNANGFAQSTEWVAPGSKEPVVVGLKSE